MLIYTSYFGNWRNFPKELKKISIARFAPNILAVSYIQELQPDKNLLQRFKDKKITEAEYTKEYRQQLAGLDPNEIAKQCENSILLCYEKSEDFCHRHLVRKWFEAHGIECKELKNA